MIKVLLCTRSENVPNHFLITSMQKVRERAKVHSVKKNIPYLFIPMHVFVFEIPGYTIYTQNISMPRLWHSLVLVCVICMHVYYWCSPPLRLRLPQASTSPKRSAKSDVVVNQTKVTLGLFKLLRRYFLFRQFLFTRYEAQKLYIVLEKRDGYYGKKTCQDWRGKRGAMQQRGRVRVQDMKIVFAFQQIFDTRQLCYAVLCATIQLRTKWYSMHCFCDGLVFTQKMVITRESAEYSTQCYCNV